LANSPATRLAMQRVKLLAMQQAKPLERSKQSAMLQVRVLAPVQ
jgi:hypothetical protein